MVSQSTRLVVWDALCDLEANMRYCVVLSDRQQRLHRRVRFSLLLGISIEGAVLYFGTLMPWLFWLGIVGGLGLAVLAIWDAMSNYAANAATLKMVASICESLKRETEVLWRKIQNGLDDEDLVEENLKVIQYRWASALQWILPELNDSLARATEEQADAEMKNRYVDRIYSQPETPSTGTSTPTRTGA